MDGTSKGDELQHTINNDNIVLRGTMLRNTKFVVGIVVYTGLDTKLMRKRHLRPALNFRCFNPTVCPGAAGNSNSTPSKRSKIDHAVNKAILFIFLALLVLCTINMVASLVWMGQPENYSSYLPGFNSQGVMTSISTWITALILYNNLVRV